MTRSVVTADPTRSLREIAVLMRERNVGSVVLVEGERAVAFITDRDIAIAVVADGRDPAGRVAEHASTPVITADPDMDVEEAAEKMARQGVRRLVVVEGGIVTGVVTLHDLTPSAGDRASALSARITRRATPRAPS